MRPQRPTRRQKQIISGFGLKAEKFLVVCETDDMVKLYNKEFAIVKLLNRLH